MDGGFADLDPLDTGSLAGVRVLAPVRARKTPARDPHTNLPSASRLAGTHDHRRSQRPLQIAGGGHRMRNAHARRRSGLQQVTVCGLAKVKGCCLMDCLHT